MFKQKIMVILMFVFYASLALAEASVPDADGGVFEDGGPIEVNITYMGTMKQGGAIKLLEAIDQVRSRFDDVTINLLLNSSGGDTATGIGVYNYLKSLPKSIKIRTHNLGIVGSASVFVYCAGSERTASPISQFFIHQGTTERTLKDATSDQFRSISEWLKLYDEMSQEVLAQCSGQALETVVKAHQRNTTMTPVEAKAFGFVHSIGNPPVTDKSGYISSSDN